MLADRRVRTGVEPLEPIQVPLIKRLEELKRTLRFVVRKVSCLQVLDLPENSVDLLLRKLRIKQTAHPS